MHAELRHERALIADAAERLWLVGIANVGDGTAVSRLERLVRNIKTDISLAIDVPLRPATDDPRGPVVVAEGSCHSGTT